MAALVAAIHVSMDPRNKSGGDEQHMMG